MSNAMTEFRIKFKIDELILAENDTWIWSLRPGQCTLGAGVLSMKAYAERLSELTPDGGRDFALIIKTIEHALAASFQYDKINYLMLMMVDRPVHYHVVPRYSRQIDHAGLSWIDKGWPKLPVLEVGNSPPETLAAIRESILAQLP